MTDQELQQLAREIATENYKHFGDEKSIDLMAHEYEDVIKRIARTHCIVSREKVISEIKTAQNELNEPSKPMLKFTLGYVLGVLHNLFGESTFEPHNPTEQ